MVNKQKIIFVIGMGRCGTSLISNCLVENGFSIGKSKNKDKNWQNPNGYFENNSFTKFHNKLLSFNNCAWNNIIKSKMSFTKQHVNEYRTLIKNEFENDGNILIKDPRLSFFSDFLKEVCAHEYDYYFLFCSRNKKECCDSLCKAQNMTYENSEKLYNTTHKFYTDEFLMVDHSDLIKSNKNTLSKIADFCDFEIQQDTDNIVDLDLYRNREDG